MALAAYLTRTDSTRGKTGFTKLLGVRYNTDSDEFLFEISPEPKQKLTKQELVITPNMYSDSLWEPRGRWQHYSKEISRTETTRSEMLTVSCAGHCLFYGHTTPAADDLPVRHADFGVIHRSSGITSPLPHPYVCRLVEDDSHIFCRPNQIAEEIKSSIDFLSFFYEKVLKFELEVELYTRSHQRSIGNTSLWDMAEKVIRDEFWEKGGTFRLKEGAAPHYGPRFEIKARDRWGRYSLCGSIQIDFELPERFDLGYLSEDGQRLRPVLIHRAIVPPAETILAIIGNECNEYWPFWLSLHQVVVIPVCAASVAYARKVVKELVDANYELFEHRSNCFQQDNGIEISEE